ncbi:MAG: RDD family protein [Verrucomicrobia bacterium]|nr:MAG: RDD family protein [Verrucomicrobiota bacterium]
MKSATLQIRTVEGVVFAQLLAGPVTRCLAWCVDLLCILAVFIVLGKLSSVLVVFSQNFATAFVTLGFFVLSIGYGIACEWGWRGQTVGKKLFHLRVVDAEGLRLQFNQVVTRNLLRFVDSLPLFYFVGGLACWFSPKCQRLGDLAANTIVIRNPRVTEPDLDQLLAGKFNSLRQFPHLAARLRQNVPPAEAAVALQALLRRDEFDPVDRVELFAELAAHFRAKVSFPPEATDGIADEQYLRNVVDIVYRARDGSRAQAVAV